MLFFQRKSNSGFWNRNFIIFGKDRQSWRHQSITEDETNSLVREKARRRLCTLIFLTNAVGMEFLIFFSSLKKEQKSLGGKKGRGEEGRELPAAWEQRAVSRSPWGEGTGMKHFWMVVDKGKKLQIKINRTLSLAAAHVNYLGLLEVIGAHIVIRKFSKLFSKNYYEKFSRDQTCQTKMRSSILRSHVRIRPQMLVFDC